jgi:hypothetical protein
LFLVPPWFFLVIPGFSRDFTWFYPGSSWFFLVLKVKVKVKVKVKAKAKKMNKGKGKKVKGKK